MDFLSAAAAAAVAAPDDVAFISGSSEHINDRTLAWTLARDGTGRENCHWPNSWTQFSFSLTVTGCREMRFNKPTFI